MNYAVTVTRKVADKALRRIKKYVTPLLPTETVDVNTLNRLLQDGGCGDLNWLREEHRAAPVIARSNDIEILRTRFGERYPDEFDWLLQRTESAINGCFAELGSEITDMKHDQGGIRWREDFKSGVTWPLNHFLKTPLSFNDNSSDIKTIWELSRFQWAPNLAQMERLTGDNLTYRTAFMELVDDWQRSNPYPLGPNWKCPMEIAIRAINILTAYEQFNKSLPLPESFSDALYAMLFQHGRHIRKNLEYTARGLNTNHYLANLIGLLALGVLFEPFAQAVEWRVFAVNELSEEIEAQTTDDGFCFESSSGYHLLTLECYLFALTVCRQNDIALPLRYIRRLGKMAALTQELTAPNGRLINIGDNDSGRLLKLAPRTDGDPRWLVLWAALEGLCANSCPEAIAQSAESVWLFGMKEAPAPREIRTKSAQVRRGVSRYHRGAGQVILRHDDLWMHVNVGQIGSGGVGGHKHNDDLALAVVWGNRELITDPGMCCYTADPTERNRLRSITSHSTVSLEAEETNRFVPGYLFALRRDGHTQVNTWLSTTELDLLQASHNCYSRLPGGPRIIRTVYFDKLARFWLIRDQVKPTSVSLKTATQQLMSHLIFPQSEIAVNNDSAICELEGDDGRRLVIRSYTSGASLKTDPFALSPSYGITRPGTRLAIRAPKGETELIWGVFPNEAHQHKEYDTELLTHKFKLLEWPTIGLSTGIPQQQIGEPVS